MATGKASPRVGAAASASIDSPNPPAATTGVAQLDRLAPGRHQRAGQRAHADHREQQRERVSSPPNVRVANSGSTTWKLNASVPMMAIITSGIQRSGTVCT